MATHKPNTKSQSAMTPEERETETVRRYTEAIEAAKSGVLKKKTAEKEKPPTDGSADETVRG